MVRRLLVLILMVGLSANVALAMPMAEGLEWSWSLPEDHPPHVAARLHVEAGPGVWCTWDYAQRTALTDADVTHILVVNEPFQSHTFSTRPMPPMVQLGPVDTRGGDWLGEGSTHGWIRFDDEAPLDLVIAGHGLYRTEEQPLPPLELAVTCDGDATLSFDTTTDFAARWGPTFDGTGAAVSEGPGGASVMRNATTQAVFDHPQVRGGLYDNGGHGEVEVNTPETTWQQALGPRVPIAGGPGTYRVTVDRVAASAQADGDQVVLFLHGWD